MGETNLENKNLEKKNSTCLIVASGPYVDWASLKKAAKNRQEYYLLCADGGYRHAQRAALTPDEIIGDFDSFSEKDLPPSVRLTRLAAQKDVTDARAAVDLGLSRGFLEFELHGMLGGRIDHCLSNLSDLYYLHQKGASARIVDPWCEVEIVEGTKKISGKPGQTVSFMMFGPPPKEITLKGFFYPLQNYRGDLSFQIGISNILTEKEAEVTAVGGLLLMMRIKKK